MRYFSEIGLSMDEDIVILALDSMESEIEMYPRRTDRFFRVRAPVATWKSSYHVQVTKSVYYLRKIVQSSSHSIRSTNSYD